MAGLTVSVVSADREIWSGAATQVVAKTLMGEMGVLRGHEPVLALLAEGGQVRVTTEDGEKITVSAEGGFFSVDHDVVTIVASQAAIVE